MSWFLVISARAGFEVMEYSEEAIGEMGHNEAGKKFVAIVTRCPTVTWTSGSEPTSDQVSQMHHEAHEECFIANCVITEVRIEI